MLPYLSKKIFDFSLIEGNMNRSNESNVKVTTSVNFHYLSELMDYKKSM